MSYQKSVVVSFFLVLFLFPSIYMRGISQEPELLDATGTFLNRFEKSTRERIRLPLTHEERTSWSYFPGKRKGISFAEMQPDQQIAAHNILRHGLSNTGYLKVTELIHLEEILGNLEGKPKYRDPEKYFFTVFGKPDAGNAWGLRVEGHHLSLNFTAKGNQLHSGTPAFFGANPAVVPSGPYAGLEVLSEEQRLARRIIRQLPEQKRNMAIFRDNAPHDIVTRNKETVTIDEQKGLPVSKMADTSVVLLKQLIKVYTGNFAEPISKKLYRKFQRGFPDRVFFGWAGSIEPGEPHYYRIHAPDILIEYDNARSGVNHIHTVIRDFEGDFGKDVLSEHYENSPHHNH